jgi:aconitate hydratase 2/2-methylisocitrate dehydratase
MLKNAREGIEPDQPGVVGPIKQIEELQKKGYPLAYVGDVVGTGSSRKSATNSVLWFMGDDIPHVPNKRGGGCASAAKLHLSSSTPWKMRAHCRLKWTCRT